jgi:hypothetical protein
MRRKKAPLLFMSSSSITNIIAENSTKFHYETFELFIVLETHITKNGKKSRISIGI